LEDLVRGFERGSFGVRCNQSISTSVSRLQTPRPPTPSSVSLASVAVAQSRRACKAG